MLRHVCKALTILLVSFLASCISFNGEQVEWGEMGDRLSNTFTSAQRKEANQMVAAFPNHPMTSIVKADSKMCWGPSHGEMYFSFALVEARNDLFSARDELKVSDPKYRTNRDAIADNADAIIAKELDGWSKKLIELRKERDEALTAKNAATGDTSDFDEGIKGIDTKIAYIEDLVTQLNAFPKRSIDRSIALKAPDLNKKSEAKNSEEATKEVPKG
jgi:hypothetical protein